LIGVGGILLYSKRTPALTNRDSIVLADFQNSTGEAVFDERSRSAAVNLRSVTVSERGSRERVRETLKLMGRSPEAPLTEPVAREVVSVSASRHAVGSKSPRWARTT